MGCGCLSVSSPATSHRPRRARPTISRRSRSTFAIPPASEGACARPTCWNARSKRSAGGPRSSAASRARRAVSRWPGPSWTSSSRGHGGSASRCPIVTRSPPSSPLGRSRRRRSRSPNLPAPESLRRQRFSSTAGTRPVLDGGRVYAERRNTKNAADAAAMAGAVVLVKSNIATSTPNVIAAACAAAFANGGFGTGSPDAQCGTSGSVVTIHVPTGSNGPSLAGVNPKFENPGYVQVGVHSSFRSFMSGLLGLADFGASALGVAVNIPGNGLTDTLLVLDPVNCAALTFNGTTDLTVSGGDVTVDSNAAKTSGPMARVKVPPFDSTAPRRTGSSGGTWNAPAPWKVSGTVTAQAGVYWGGISVPTSGDTLHLASGTYIMAGGGFNVGSGTVDETGPVTIIMTDDPYCNTKLSAFPSGCGSPQQKNGNLDGSHDDGTSSTFGQTGGGNWGTSTTPLTAQTFSPDPYSLSGILIYVDRNAIANGAPPKYINTTLNIGGSGYFNFATGTIVYAPCSAVILSGTSDPPSQGGAVIAYDLTVNGTKNFNLGGPGQGLQ